MLVPSRRNRGRAGDKRCFIEPAKIEVAVRQVHGIRRRAGHGWLKQRQFAQIALRAKQEHAAVSVIVARRDKADGGILVRLFD